MKSNKEFIQGIYDKYNEYENNQGYVFKKSENHKKHPQKNFLALKLLALAAVFVLAFSTVLIYQNYNKNQNLQMAQKPQDNNEAEEISLATVDSFENFYNIIKNANLDEELNSAKSESTLQESIADSMQNDTNSNRDSEELDLNYSKTNTQVKGVDEADIVKTDGNYIYYVANENIIIVDIRAPEGIKVVGKISFENTKISPSEIYINENKLIVLGNTYENITVTYEINARAEEDIASAAGYNKNKAVVIVYDISSKEEPKEERRIEINGYYVSSRMIGNNIYFVSNYYLSNLIGIARYPVQELKQEDYMVSYTDSKVSSEERYIDFNKVHYFEDIEDTNYLTIVGFSLDNDEQADIQTFLGAGNEIYCSLENMYIQKSKYTYQLDQNQRITNSSTSKKIFKFNLNDGKIRFKAEAEVPGVINNQFSMDENEKGEFRIATTISDNWTTTDDTSNRLYVLDEDLKLIGKLEGLAKGEKIYSVRYMGDRAYIVTFKQVDPLFVIDLSDGKNPKVLGELKIPGYSTYLHPYDENHIIGFGYNTKENGTTVTNEGLKMSMFDITDFNNPKELFKVDIGNSYTSSELTYNHKALLYSKDKNIIAFPITTYNRKTISSARFYEISLENGFVLKGEVSHGSDYENQIKRIIFANDYYYTLSNGLIKVIRMNDLQEVGQVEI